MANAGRIAMAGPVQLWHDADAAALSGVAEASRDPDPLRRFLLLAESCDTRSRGDAAELGGVGLQTVRDWVLRFKVGGPKAPIDPKPPGNIKGH